MKVAEAVEVVGFDTNDELSHVYCCNEDLALCGADISNLDFLEEEGEDLCIVCRELEKLACVKCGW